MLLLTGATGYIGQRLLQQLKKSSAVAVLTRKKNSQLADRFPDVIFIEGDLNSPQSLEGKLKNITAVIHMAAVTHAKDEKTYYQVNVEGTQKLIAALPTNLNHFVYASTNCAEPDSGGYGESKLVTEQLLLQSYKNVVLLRIADVYGGSGEKSLEQLIDRSRKTRFFPVIGSGEYMMAPVHVDDVIVALVRSLSLTGQHTLVVAGPDKVSFSGLISKMYEYRHVRPIKIYLPVWLMDIMIRLLAKLPNVQLYADQVKRLTVKKNVDSSQTWQLFRHQPQSFFAWLAQKV